MTPTTKTRVRYAVHYNERNYEYVLHSDKRHFLRNLADVINILEYCVTQDLKKNDYKVDFNAYNYDVIRLVNDKPDENWINSNKFKDGITSLIGQMIDDTIQRNK